MDYFDLINRVGMGFFFASSGAHKLFDPVVRPRFQKLCSGLGVSNLWAVLATGELLGGLGLLTGTLTPVAALGMIVILLGAIYLDVWKADVVAKNPRDPADWVAKTIYLPEVLMVFLLSTLVFAAPTFGIDWAILNLFGWSLF